MPHEDIPLSRTLRDDDLQATTSSPGWREPETWLPSGSTRSSGDGEVYYRQAQDCEVHIHDDVETNAAVDDRCGDEAQAYSCYRSSAAAVGSGAAELLRGKLKVTAVAGCGLREYLRSKARDALRTRWMWV